MLRPATPLSRIYSGEVRLVKRCFRLRKEQKISETVTQESQPGAGACPRKDKGFHTGEDVIMIGSSAPRSLLLAGAFIGVLPNQDGLLHVSEIAHERVGNVLDYMNLRLTGRDVVVAVVPMTTDVGMPIR